ncbi:MAG: Rrf2 family transcriptional regulator [Methylocystaceae bacterium]|nr:Rrf2 family transcriptional regulator [Methylocystaceae bacterium]
MKLLRRPARFALLAALDIALHARGRPVSSKELAARYDLPPRRLEVLLQAMVRSGILRSLRGPAGGYELARERRRICVGEIIRVALGVDEEAGTAPSPLDQLMDPLLAEAEGRALAYLDEINLDTLYTGALALEDKDRLELLGDFNI